MPLATVVEFLICVRLFPELISKISNVAEGLSVARSRRPSGVTARLYGPRPVLNFRDSVHDALSISSISSLLLQATYTLDPSAEGWAHVGEHVAGAMGCRPDCPA